MKVKPFLRWVGGKNWLANELAGILSDTIYNDYHEPFLGSGSIFFNTVSAINSFLSDSNSELISTYKTVRDFPKEVFEKLITMVNSSDEYYRIRSSRYTDPIEIAARFIYLNQTSFNGVYRVNKTGDYNVPYGKRKNVQFSEERIFLASKKLQGAQIKCCDFEETQLDIKRGDLVYLDPPYTVSHNNNGFIEYNQKLFQLEDQYRLSKFIDMIKLKDAYYILSHAAHATIREIFDKNDYVKEFERQSLVSGISSKRGIVKELIFTNIRRIDNGKLS